LESHSKVILKCIESCVKGTIFLFVLVGLFFWFLSLFFFLVSGPLQ
jgi:hypothetical protein